MATKKTHPADTADLALIPPCKTFTATILKSDKQQTVSFDSLAAARIEAARLNATANNGRKALVMRSPPKAARSSFPPAMAAANRRRPRSLPRLRRPKACQASGGREGREAEGREAESREAESREKASR